MELVVREWYSARLSKRGIAVGWGRDKNGRFFAEYARDAEAAWMAAQAAVTYNAQVKRQAERSEDCRLETRVGRQKP